MAPAETVGDWRAYLQAATEDEAAALERRVATGRPWAGEGFIDRLERKTGRVLRPRKGGWPKGRRRKR